MKNKLSTLFVFLGFVSGFSQNPKQSYSGTIPSVRKEKLQNVNFISELTPQLWQKMILPIKEREQLDRLRRNDSSQGYYFYPPANSYYRILDLEAVEITATCNGKGISSRSKGDQLTREQKALLSAVDLNTDIRLRITFSYKNQAERGASTPETIEGGLIVTVIPEFQAEYPPGLDQLIGSLREKVLLGIPGRASAEKIQQTVLKFTVNEEGRVEDARVIRSSPDPKMDKLLLQALYGLPGWIPAVNSKGRKVKQTFKIPLGVEGC